jgi:hypothetical protein
MTSCMFLPDIWRLEAATRGGAAVPIDVCLLQVRRLRNTTVQSYEATKCRSDEPLPPQSVQHSQHIYGPLNKGTHFLTMFN